MFSHGPLGRLPVCKVIRFNIEYTILYVEEKLPENFVIRELDLFCKYDMFLDPFYLYISFCISLAKSSFIYDLYGR